MKTKLPKKEVWTASLPMMHQNQPGIVGQPKRRKRRRKKLLLQTSSEEEQFTEQSEMFPRQREKWCVAFYLCVCVWVCVCMCVCVCVYGCVCDKQRRRSEADLPLQKRKKSVVCFFVLMCVCLNYKQESKIYYP